jgi:hypothetical protein
MQWTIDPRNVPSGEVCQKAIRLYEATPRVIVRTSNAGFRTPSWNKRPQDLPEAERRDRYCLTCRTDHNGLWYHQIVVADPDREAKTVIFKVTCDCPHGQAARPGSKPCHHGEAAVLERQRQDFPRPEWRIITPAERPAKPRKTKRTRPLTVIPGGKA